MARRGFAFTEPISSATQHFKESKPEYSMFLFVKTVILAMTTMLAVPSILMLDDLKKWNTGDWDTYFIVAAVLEGVTFIAVLVYMRWFRKVTTSPAFLIGHSCALFLLLVLHLFCGISVWSFTGSAETDKHITYAIAFFNMIVFVLTTTGAMFFTFMWSPSGGWLQKESLQ